MASLRQAPTSRGSSALMTMGVKLISCISNRGALNAPTSSGGSAGFTMGLKLISGISNIGCPVPTLISGSAELTVGSFPKSIALLSQS